MNKSEYLTLTPHEQEDYLNSGGMISPDSTEGLMILPSGVEQEKSQLERLVPSREEVLSPSLHQLAPSVDREPARPWVGTKQAVKDKPQATRVLSNGNEKVYDGEVEADVSQEQVYSCWKDPVELLYFLDEEIASRKVKLHPWQIQFMLDFANGLSGVPTQDNPFQALVRAANGSGKDKYCIAPCAVWLCMCTTMYASAVVTSSSGVQLDNQTCAYIEQLCESAKQKIHSKCWKVNYRYYECLDTKSPIMCFATDEPGKAEGYHPLKFGAKMAIFESEAKTVPDSIYIAQNKCTGYTHRCMVSTPGLPLGHFYGIHTIAISRKAIESVNDITNIDWAEYHITAYDCSHIPRSYIEQMKRDLPGGENGSAFKSQVLAEFGSTDEMVVIPTIYIRRCIKNKIAHVSEEFDKGGLDLSDGGAETVLVIRNGNKHLKTIPFRFDSTEETLDFLEEKFKENNLTHPNNFIFADCCGIGSPMIQSLRRRGWKNVKFVDSRHKSRLPKVYYNTGTELFFNLRKAFERSELILLEDPVLTKQLGGRYYKITPGNIHQLLSKLEQKSRGYPSPDRADALNLAFWDYKSPYTETVSPRGMDTESNYVKLFSERKEVGTFTLKNWSNGSDSPARRLGKRPDNSLMLEQIDYYNRNLSGK